MNKITFLLLSAFLCLNGNTAIIKNFSSAKKVAAKINKEHPYTIYCACKYSGSKVDLQSCGYKIHKDRKRAQRLEWEHVVPAEAFGNSFAEWREGGPKCSKHGRNFKGRKCAETNSEFSAMEADLHNLWPEVGELNGLRNNYSMAALGGPKRNPAAISFGGCEAVISEKKFEPMDEAKGIVARTYMYMAESYPGRGIISDKNQKLFEAWDKMYPPNAWECKRGKMIDKIQGSQNRVLASRCNH